MSRRDWRIGVAGLGTVGTGLLKFLAERPDFAPAGGRATVTGVGSSRRISASMSAAERVWVSASRSGVSVCPYACAQNGCMTTPCTSAKTPSDFQVSVGCALADWPWVAMFVAC